MADKESVGSSTGRSSTLQGLRTAHIVNEQRRGPRIMMISTKI